MKKKYLHEGAFWFFEEGQQPKGAIEVAEETPKAKTAEPKPEAGKPANKARETKNK